MCFTEAYAGCTVCASSRCVLMAGKHAGNACIRGDSGRKPSLPEDVTVAELFKQAGYTTGGFGKWGLGVMGSSGMPLKQGFDTFYGYYDHNSCVYVLPIIFNQGWQTVCVARQCPENGDEDEKTPINTREEIHAVFKKDVSRGLKKGTVKTTNFFGEEREFNRYLIFDETFGFYPGKQKQSLLLLCGLDASALDLSYTESDASWLMYQEKPWSLEARIHA